MSQNIKNIKIEESTLGVWSPDVNHDIKVAIYDLLEENYFHLLGSDEDLFNLILQLEENKLTLKIFSISNEINLRSITVNVKKLRKLIREYIILCDSYYLAIKSAPIGKLETIDVGRKSLHDQASEEFIEKVKNYVDVDLNTARRFITLISVLQRKSSNSFDSY